MHGPHGQRLFDVVQATTRLLLVLLYSSPFGDGSLGKCNSINGPLRKLALFPLAFLLLNDMYTIAAALFRAVLLNLRHILHNLLPPPPCNRRPRPRDLSLSTIGTDNFAKKTSLTQMSYDFIFKFCPLFIHV